jgi:hypothetical protein
MPMDVQDEASVERAVTATVTQFSRLDILVNNAGLVQVEAAWEATAQSWQAVIERNLTGAFYCAKHAARTMIAAGQGGKIINISSVIAHLGPPDFASYATNKAGLSARHERWPLNSRPTIPRSTRYCQAISRRRCQRVYRIGCESRLSAACRRVAGQNRTSWSVRPSYWRRPRRAI